MDNMSFCPQTIEVLKDILNDITTDIIKEGRPIIIVEEYQWMVETLSLMAKQVGLCESCVLLLENGMEQEAFLLVRSQFNNMLWIKYICDFNNSEHIKEYIYQPYISQIKVNKNLKKMLENFESDLDNRFDKASMLLQLDEAINRNQTILKENNIPNKQKTVAELAKQNGLLFGTYITLYNDASKFEHSDVEKIRKYRKRITNEYNENEIFSIDMSTSDKTIWMSVLYNSLMNLYLSYESFFTRITKYEEQLFNPTYPNGKSAYSKNDVEKILVKLKVCIDFFENERN